MALGRLLRLQVAAIIFTLICKQITTMPHSDAVTLINAFEATDYFIHAEQSEHCVNIGSHCSDALRRWLKTHCNTSCAWIVTAYNPKAEQSEDISNRQRHAALRACLDADGHDYVATNSRAHDGNWPDEPGVCVVDMDEGLARALALRFGQLALVAVPIDGPVQLVWTNPAI